MPASKSSRSEKSAGRSSDNRAGKANNSRKTSTSTSNGSNGRTAKSRVSIPALKLTDKRKKLLKNVLLWLAVFIVTLVTIDYAVQYLNNKASVAIVNGERIFRGEFHDELESVYGTTIASQMIDERLFKQEAERLNITVSEDDIAGKIEEFEEQYGGPEGLLDALAASNLDMEELRDRIASNLIVEKILADDIEVTDEEIQEYYEQYQDQTDQSLEDSRGQIEASLRNQKLQEAYQPWVTELREDANIKNNIENPKDYSFLGITRAFFEDLFGA